MPKKTNTGPAPRKGETIGGGFLIFRRGKTTGRIGISTTLPFEHPSLEAALREAARLAALTPGETYAVFQQVNTVSAGEPTP